MLVFGLGTGSNGSAQKLRSFYALGLFLPGGTLGARRYKPFLGVRGNDGGPCHGAHSSISDSPRNDKRLQKFNAFQTTSKHF